MLILYVPVDLWIYFIFILFLFLDSADFEDNFNFCVFQIIIIKTN